MVLVDVKFWRAVECVARAERMTKRSLCICRWCLTARVDIGCRACTHKEVLNHGEGVGRMRNDANPDLK